MKVGTKGSNVIIVMVLICVLDQLSKLAIMDWLHPGAIYPVIPKLFNLTLTFNKGIAFGLFSDFPDMWRQIFLGVTTLAAVCVLLYLLRHEYYNSKVGRFALALILGGAVGNIIDRVRLGYVVDFLDFYLGSYHWPAFNVADSAICVGIVILLIIGDGKSASSEEV